MYTIYMWVCGGLDRWVGGRVYVCLYARMDAAHAPPSTLQTPSILPSIHPSFSETARPGLGSVLGRQPGIPREGAEEAPGPPRGAWMSVDAWCYGEVCLFCVSLSPNERIGREESGWAWLWSRHHPSTATTKITHTNTNQYSATPSPRRTRAGPAASAPGVGQ